MRRFFYDLRSIGSKFVCFNGPEEGGREARVLGTNCLLLREKRARFSFKPFV